MAILAFPETTASVVYGMYDLFASAGRDWGFVVSGEAGPELMRPVVVAARGGAFEAANRVTIAPHSALESAASADIVCVPELAVPPGGNGTPAGSAVMVRVPPTRSPAVAALLTMRVANTYCRAWRSASASSSVGFPASPPRR